MKLYKGVQTMFDKILQINLLLDFYGQLLTERQQDILQLYYTDDLSLGEISEQLHISRQAVFDTMKRAEKLLFEYEKKLDLVNASIYTKKQTQKIIETAEELEQKILRLSNDTEDILLVVEKIKEISQDILEK